MQTLRTGARTPFFATDIVDYHNMATHYSPIDDLPAIPTLAELSAYEVFLKSGFLAANATDTAGLIYVVTWNEFQTHRQQSNINLVTDVQVLALCAPVAIYLASGDWTMTPIVKIFATDNQTYPTVVTYVNIGTIR